MKRYPDPQSNQKREVKPTILPDSHEQIAQTAHAIGMHSRLVQVFSEAIRRAKRK